MASQRRFDGPVLEDLLDRVRAEAGPGAQIVAANRVRKGGLGGFFAKEYFEVVVDVLDESDIVIAEGDDEIADEIALMTSGASSPAASVEAMAAMVAEAPGANGTRRVPASILDLAEAVNDDERHGGNGSGGGIGGGGGGGGGGVRATQRATIDLVDDAPIVDDPPVVDAPAPDAPTRFASILESLAQEQDAPPATRGRASRGGIATEVRDRMAEQAETARRTATAARIASDPVEIDDEPEPIITPTAMGVGVEIAKPAAFRRIPRSEAVLERPENVLARLGLPARLVPRGASMKELRGALIESLAELPASPPVPEANGVVIAVVGPGSSAVLLARDLCAEYGLDTERIVLATQEPLGEGIPAWLQICDGSTAEERRRSWRRRTQPTFVAVSLPPGRDALPWARDILDRLEPTIAWSLVNAGWKSEDVRDWIERLGGVDTLALSHLDETVSPAAILELGVPVGRVDGRPATALAWAELLMARMQ